MYAFTNVRLNSRPIILGRELRKMSTLSKKLVALLAVIIFSMAMYGCGGGGGSSGPTAMPDPDPMPMPDPDPTPHTVDLSDLTVAAGDYEVPAGGTLDVGAGETEVTFSCPGDTACMVTVADDGTATSTGGAATAALSAAAMQAIADRVAEEERTCCLTYG